MLLKIQENYKKDMLANQEEFVYVTWQERERNKQAQDYLTRALRHKAITHKNN